MNKYQQICETVERVSKEIIGKTPAEAIEIICTNELACRYISIDGRGCMITADCKMERIGFIVNDGIITSVQNG